MTRKVTYLNASTPPYLSRVQYFTLGFVTAMLVASLIAVMVLR